MAVAGLCIDQDARQRVLDASMELLWCRRNALAGLGRGEPDGVEIVASGDLAHWTMARATGWGHLLSTRTSASSAALRRSLPVNRRACEEHGLSMVSVFDFDSTEPAARTLLDNEPSSDYYYAFAPVQMKIVDRAQVLIQGDVDRSEQSLISLTSEHAIAAAHRYWEAVGRTTTPCRIVEDEPRLTERQCAIFDLMLTGTTDTAIARKLGVSVRTVRGDVSAAEQSLGVRSRFAAGFAYAALLRVRLEAPG